MFLKYFYDRHLAQASYMVGCPACGEALVIDPARDIEPYLQAAQERGVKITGVAETHIHADYASGGHELAAATGATLYLSGHGDEHGYDFQFDDVRAALVHEGSVIQVGNVRLDVLHTPGHTPEHVAYQVTDSSADSPLGIFAGDCIFVGDVGRPDLLETAADMQGTKAIGARQQFASVERFKAMPDYLQIFPGHGAGSACGKALGDIPSTTVGYEKRFNPAFQFDDESAFTTWLLDGQTPPPRYFKQMKRLNQHGVPLLNTLSLPEPITDAAQIEALPTRFLVIDTRPTPAFAAGHIPNTIGIPADYPQFSTWAGWYIDYDQPTYLVVDEHRLREVVGLLRAIGVDHIPGYIPSHLAARYEVTVPQLDVQEVAAHQQHGALVLDVRNPSEREADYIPGSKFISMGAVPKHLDELPRDREIIVQCGSGIRSQIVASLLQREGFKHVYNFDGGMDAWKRADMPLEAAKA